MICPNCTTAADLRARATTLAVDKDVPIEEVWALALRGSVNVGLRNLRIEDITLVPGSVEAVAGCIPALALVKRIHAVCKGCDCQHQYPEVRKQ